MAMLAPADQAYFRESRAKRFGQAYRGGAGGPRAQARGIHAGLEPLRNMLSYQPFIGGACRCLPTTSCSARSSGFASSRRSRHWPATIQWPNGFERCSTCMEGPAGASPLAA